LFNENDLRALTDFNSEGYLLTTMYFHVPKIQTLSHSKEQIALKDLFRQARRRWDQDHLPKALSESLEQDSQQMIEFLSAQSENGRRDQALFACSARDFFRAIPLPRSPETKVCVGDTFRIRPLLAQLDAYPRHCVVVVDREKAGIYLFDMGAVEERASMQHDVPGHTRESGFGGYLERRIERHLDQEVQRHYQHVIEQLQALHKRHKFDRLIMAGHKENKAEFEKLLPEEMRRRLIGRFVIDAKLATLQQVRDKAQEVLRQHENDAKRRLVQLTLDNAGPMGRAVIGLDGTLEALQKREVQILLIGDNLSAGGRRCANCGYLGGVALSGCPNCGGGLQAVDDIVEYAITEAVRTGSEVRLIDGSPEFERAGNIAAVLRYRSGQPTS
jgi:peptide subunit release factor 1 (eRF1)